MEICKSKTVVLNQKCLETFLEQLQARAKGISTDSQCVKAGGTVAYPMLLTSLPSSKVCGPKGQQC